jgi:hypothetical protein
VCLLPILNDRGDHLFSSRCVRLHLRVYHESEHTEQDYRQNESLRTCPSNWSHAVPTENASSYASLGQGINVPTMGVGLAANAIDFSRRGNVKSPQIS